MILSDYYKLERLPEFANRKTPRYDCTASTGRYPLFERMAAASRVKRFFCYYNGIPGSFSDIARQQAERAITNTKNISSVFIPDLHSPLYGFGDVKGTLDAILFIFSPDYQTMEIFISRGNKMNQRGVYNLLVSGQLNGELAALRGVAK